MKKFIPAIGIGLISLSTLAVLFHALETYNEVVHNEASFYVTAYAIAAIVISTIIWRKNRIARKHLSVVWFLSLLIMGFVYYAGNKIPFCVECDHVTAEDLGFLIHWIQPIY